MRMQLFKVEIERAHGWSKGHIIALSELQAAELVIDHDIALKQDHIQFALERVDENFSRDRQIGLDDMLESAPVGFVSYCKPIGWIVHVAARQTLRLFKIVDEHATEAFIIAPDANIASALYVCDRMPIEGERRQFKISDALADLPPERATNIEQLLEFSPVGIAEFDDKHGWLVW